MDVDQVDILLLVVTVLDRLSIPYCVGGSYASSVYGISRATRDIDLIAAIKPNQVHALAVELEPNFYADEQALATAVRLRRSFNVLHLDSMFKVDIFVSKGIGFDAKQIERRQAQDVKREPPRVVYVASAEDTALAKLAWYRLGNEVSDQQWRDVLNVIEVQGDKLDLDYMRHWAQELGVADLLEQALIEAKKNG